MIMKLGKWTFSACWHSLTRVESLGFSFAREPSKNLRGFVFGASFQRLHDNKLLITPNALWAIWRADAQERCYWARAYSLAPYPNGQRMLKLGFNPNLRYSL